MFFHSQRIRRGDPGWRLHRVPTVFAVCLSQCLRARGEDQALYRYENYQEDAGRIAVETHSFLFALQPKSWLAVQGEVVYDAISGFSPTGAPPPSTITFVQSPPPPGASNNSVPISEMHDVRVSGTGSATFTIGNHRYTPSFSYGQEHDYRTRGAALNYSADYNDKNTTLNLGWSHDWDEVLPNGFLHNTRMNKEADDWMAGVNQLLGPKTVLTVNLTYGHSRGYLNDQYKGVLFDNEPQGDASSPALEPENRPRKRDRYVGYFSLTQDVTPLDASIEGSYRYSYDSYHISAHALQLAWYQKIGKHLIVSPSFRYYVQNAAYFYATRFPDFNNAPAYYSADYRLSELESFAAGLTMNWKVNSWLGFDASYKRYVMKGLDGETSSTAYPSANIFSIGARLWF